MGMNARLSLFLRASLIVLLAIGGVLCVYTGLQPGALAPRAGVATPTSLTFDTNGRFRMVLVADTHYGTMPGQPFGVPAETSRAKTLSFLDMVYAKEHPDLVVHIGDLIDWSTADANSGIDAVLGVAIKRDIPWVATLGIHDDDPEFTLSCG